MVCTRCKVVVKDELTKLGVPYISVEPGEAEITGEIVPEMLQAIKSALQKSGLELMDDRKSVLIQNIKTSIIQMVHYTEEPLKVNYLNISVMN